MITWKVKYFKELSLEELYTILRLRVDIFVVEQNCAYPEIDGKDVFERTQHLLGFNEEGIIVAYSRILAAGDSYDEVAIGRVVTSALVRGQGVGDLLLEKSLEVIEKSYGKVNVVLGGQVYIQKFYEKFGFKATSEEYLEDGIPHVDMLREPVL